MTRKIRTRRAGRRAVGYIRVSDESQVDGHSLSAQRREIEQWCGPHGYELVKVYADEGVSAHTDRIEKRPQLLALLEDARKGLVDVVVVHTIDRWARNVGVQREALRRLGEAEVGFYSVMENLDWTTPVGRFALNSLGGAAELMSDLLGVHVLKAQRERVNLGRPNGPTPFGYEVSEPGGVPMVVLRKAEAIQQVYERRALGESTGSLARWLNSAGFRTQKGHIFTSHAVKDLLNTRFYVGRIEYQGEEFPGRHQAIIREELYERVQSRRQRREVTRTVEGPKGLLQGIVFCGQCGHRLQSDRHRLGAPRYRERHALECPNNEKSSVAKPFDDQIGAILQTIQLRSEWRQRMVNLAVTDRTGPDLKVLKEKRRRLSIAYADLAMSNREYRVKLAELDQQLREAGAVWSPDVEEAAKLFESVPSLWNEATPEERRKLLSPLIERVYVDMEAKQVGAITPVPAFRALLDHAMVRARSSACLLISSEEADRLKVWSWWRRGSLHTAREHSLAVLMAAA